MQSIQKYRVIGQRFQQSDAVASHYVFKELVGRCWRTFCALDLV